MNTSAARVPAGAVTLALAGVVTVALLTMLTVVAAHARTAVGSARRDAAATRTAVETLATLEALGCDQMSATAPTRLCTQALGYPQDATRPPTLGDTVTAGRRDGQAYTLSTSTSSDLACAADPAVVTDARAVVRRTVTVTMSGTHTTRTLVEPVAALVLVPAPAGTPVTLTGNDGSTVRIHAGPSGCAAFPATAGTTATLPDGTVLRIPADRSAR